MSDRTIQEGDLLAYLEGQDLPHVAEALANSPELRAEYEALKQLHEKLLTEYGGVLIPDPQDMVDVVAGQATLTQKLLVYAYVRQSPQGRAEMDALEAEWAAESPPKWWKLPEFLARPLQLTGVRGSQTATSAAQTYYTAVINAQITLQIPPAHDDRRPVEGYATQDDQPPANCPVSLQGADIITTETDEMGFFTFADVPNGRYDLRLYLDNGILLIPDITLTDD